MSSSGCAQRARTASAPHPTSRSLVHAARRLKGASILVRRLLVLLALAPACQGPKEPSRARPAPHAATPRAQPPDAGLIDPLRGAPFAARLGALLRVLAPRGEAAGAERARVEALLRTRLEVLGLRPLRASRFRHPVRVSRRGVVDALGTSLYTREGTRVLPELFTPAHYSSTGAFRGEVTALEPGRVEPHAPPSTHASAARPLAGRVALVRLRSRRASPTAQRPSMEDHAAALRARSLGAIAVLFVEPSTPSAARAENVKNPPQAANAGALASGVSPPVAELGVPAGFIRPSVADELVKRGRAEVQGAVAMRREWEVAYNVVGELGDACATARPVVLGVSLAGAAEGARVASPRWTTALLLEVAAHLAPAADTAAKRALSGACVLVAFFAGTLSGPEALMGALERAGQRPRLVVLLSAADRAQPSHDGGTAPSVRLVCSPGAEGARQRAASWARRTGLAADAQACGFDELAAALPFALGSVPSLELHVRADLRELDLVRSLLAGAVTDFVRAAP